MAFFKAFIKTTVTETQTAAVAVKTEVIPPVPTTLASLPSNVVDVSAAVEDVQAEAADKLAAGATKVTEEATTIATDATTMATEATAEAIAVATDAAGTISEEIVDVIMPDDDKLPWFLKLVNCCGGRMAFLKLAAKQNKIDTNDLPGTASSVATTVSAVLPASAVKTVTISAIPAVTA